jgi:tripartite-type tricarboxylate transporter receptor subunit TctC
MRRLAKVLAAGLVIAATPAGAQPAADYPNRPVRIIVNVTPGGGVDIATRLVAQKLQERLGQPFIVENRAGAAGNAAAEAVYRAPPDGYTLLASFNSTVSISDYLFKTLNYEPLGFEPVSVLTQIPLALVVRPDFPAADASAFIAYAKANPGKLTYASNGVGTAGHLTAEFFMSLTGSKMTPSLQGNRARAHRPRRRPRRSHLHSVFGVLRAAQSRPRAHSRDRLGQAPGFAAGCSDLG